MSSSNASPVGEWERSHPKTETGVPSRLFTDENPATTIKGTGYKNRNTAERTIYLTSQKGVRYKQYWTIKAMRERAAYHSHQTRGMRDAIEVFDKWMKEEEKKPPLSSQERLERELEWEEYWGLCQSLANAHSYEEEPSKDDLKRARDDLKRGKECLIQVLEITQRKAISTIETVFPLTAYTAIFGGPGLHSYGKHKIGVRESHVVIDGMGGFIELLPTIKKVSSLIDGSELETVNIFYDRLSKKARAEIVYKKGRKTIASLWNSVKEQSASSDPGTLICSAHKKKTEHWVCEACTFNHFGKVKQLYLACEVCGTARSPTKQSVSQKKNNIDRRPFASSSALSKQQESSPSLVDTPASWGSLRPPTERDICGPRKRQKALDAPPPSLDFLVVLDLEWTADDKTKMLPICEITQLPSVLMKLVDKQEGEDAVTSMTKHTSPVALPSDLYIPSLSNKTDAYAISAFDTFVRPTLNPVLTKFSIDLTAITQKDVDRAPMIEFALKTYMKWLESIGLVNSNGFRTSDYNWCFCTWGDVDIMSTLRKELTYKDLALPPCFNRWINLKSDSIFKKHYGREPKGGLRACVESVGARFDGRAHNGFVDSLNTAKIVRHMVQTGFRFTQATRGLDKNGIPFGQKIRNNKER
jgi:inhibitor of KinA sporulation pathway (predicted exonuclease)